MPFNSACSSRLPRKTRPTKRSSGRGGAAPLTFVVRPVIFSFDEKGDTY